MGTRRRSRIFHHSCSLARWTSAKLSSENKNRLHKNLFGFPVSVRFFIDILVVTRATQRRLSASSFWLNASNSSKLARHRLRAKMSKRCLSWPSRASHPLRQLRTSDLFRVTTSRHPCLQSSMIVPTRSSTRVALWLWKTPAPRIAMKVATTRRRTRTTRPSSGESSAGASTKSKRLSWSTSARWTTGGARAASQASPRGSALATLKSTNGSTIVEEKKRLKKHQVERTVLSSKAWKTRRGDTSECQKAQWEKMNNSNRKMKTIARTAKN